MLLGTGPEPPRLGTTSLAARLQSEAWLRGSATGSTPSRPRPRPRNARRTACSEAARARRPPRRVAHASPSAGVQTSMAAHLPAPGAAMPRAVAPLRHGCLVVKPIFVTAGRDVSAAGQPAGAFRRRPSPDSAWFSSSVHCLAEPPHRAEGPTDRSDWRLAGWRSSVHEWVEWTIPPDPTPGQQQPRCEHSPAGLEQVFFVFSSARLCR